MARKKQLRSGWISAIVVAGIIFSLFSLYLFDRRGYYNLYIINKVLGSTAVVLAGLTLTLGPLAGKIKSLVRFLSMRKELGLLALKLALLHAIVSVFLLSNKFPVSWFQKEWVPVAFGGSAIFIWLLIPILLHEKHIAHLGEKTWRKYQSIAGRAAFVLIFLHLVVMKWPGWLRWWNGQVKASPDLANPTYPPASLFVLAAMILVILIRTYNRIAKKR